MALEFGFWNLEIAELRLRRDPEWGELKEIRCELSLARLFHLLQDSSKLGPFANKKSDA